MSVADAPDVPAADPVRRRKLIKRPGLSVQLLALVAVPLALVLALSGRLLLSDAAQRNRGVDLSGQLRRVSELSALRFSLTRERNLMLIIDEAERLPGGMNAANELLGVDLVETLRTAATATDQGSVALRGYPEAEGHYDAVRLARVNRLAMLQTGRPRVGQVITSGGVRYAALERTLRLLTDHEINDARGLVNRIGSRGELQVTLSVLDESLRLHDAIDAQVWLLFEPGPGAGSSEADRVAMIRAQEQQRLSSQRLEQLVGAGGPTASALAAVRSSAGHRILDAGLDQSPVEGAEPGSPPPTEPAGGAVSASLGPQPVLPTPAGRLDRDFAAISEISELNSGLIEAATNEALAASQSLAAEAARHGLIAAALAVAVLVVTATITAAVERSLRRPLQRLHHRAEQLLSGGQDTDPLREVGPREVRVVTRAFNEFATNLAQIEQQTEALARAELDHVSLAQPVVGTIGASLRAAVSRLGEAMQHEAAMRDRLSHDANHDPLTGLLNRAAALSAVRAALARAERTGSRAAVLFIDLDGFKQVNDLYGHAVGDDVLRAVVRRLEGLSRTGDTVARLGGDEFLIVAEQFNDLDEVVALGQRVVTSIAQPIEVDQLLITVGASVGVATGERLDDVDVMVADADLAVYQAKASGKGQVEVFHAGLRQELSRRSALEADLRQALGDGSLKLNFQPVADADGQRVRSVEALLRWNRPGHGPVPPTEFLAVAETSVLITDLGRWVLDQVAWQLADWQHDPVLSPLVVRVNIPARHLVSRSFVADVRASLAKAGVAPSSLIVEVTETALLVDLAVAADHLRQLQGLGVGVALDGFGNGHSSFMQLRDLAFDSVKIDRSHVVAMSSGANPELTDTLTALARALGTAVVAEGVEEYDQLDRLVALGCDQVQGFLVCPPLPAAELSWWLWEHFGSAGSVPMPAQIAGTDPPALPGPPRLTRIGRPSPMPPAVHPPAVQPITPDTPASDAAAVAS